jgi:hypothetical protein
MAATVVNLDALIPREDFEVESGNESSNVVKIERVPIRDLEAGFFYNALRKPDFQRETANWPPEKILDLVKTFVNGDLIPAVILWQSGRDIFVIDGAHRLSALLAWVHNDYGDGPRSREFFRNQIPPEQQRAADTARTLIDGELGSYDEHAKAAKFPDQSRVEVRDRANRLGYLALPVQWVPAGDAQKAEDSFFKINQAGTAIDPTETRILKSRFSPSALAARLIVRNATGHRYWSQFSPDRQKSLEGVAKEIYETLFTPSLAEPIKTLDIPVAGRGYSADTLPIIFELVNLANEIRVVDATKKKKSEEFKTPEVDPDGQKTFDFLINTRKLSRLLSGTHPSSLGLHPAVYFYSAVGRYQPTSFMAVVSLIKDIDRRGKLKEFISVRAKFEEFIIKHKTFSNRVAYRYGSGAKGFMQLRSIYERILTELQNGRDIEAVEQILRADPELAWLKVEIDGESAGSSTRFTRTTKSAAFLAEALKNPLRCTICHGLIHMNSISIDHITRRRDGGASIVENAQLAHPFCNSTVKN